MHDLRRMIGRVAPSAAPVVISGPTGAGKELVARAIHDHSGRKGRFVAFNVHAVSETLAESELFGVERGAFTGAVSRKGLIAAADGGTLVLDEAGDLPHYLQRKLLRAVELKEVRRVGGDQAVPVDFRLIVCVQDSPMSLRRRGQWRNDFYYRVTGLVVRVPPLGARLEDLGHLVAHAVRRLAIPPVDPGAIQALHGYSWPGNVRELFRVLEQAAFHAEGGLIDGQHIRMALEAAREESADDPGEILTLAEAERRHVVRVWAQLNRDAEATCTALGLSRSALYRRLLEYGLSGEPRSDETDRRRFDEPRHSRSHFRDDESHNWDRRAGRAGARRVLTTT